MAAIAVSYDPNGRLASQADRPCRGGLRALVAALGLGPSALSLGPSEGAKRNQVHSHCRSDEVPHAGERRRGAEVSRGEGSALNCEHRGPRPLRALRQYRLTAGTGSIVTAGEYRPGIHRGFYEALRRLPTHSSTKISARPRGHLGVAERPMQRQEAGRGCSQPSPVKPSSQVQLPSGPTAP